MLIKINNVGSLIFLLRHRTARGHQPVRAGDAHGWTLSCHGVSSCQLALLLANSSLSIFMTAAWSRPGLCVA